MESKGYVLCTYSTYTTWAQVKNIHRPNTYTVFTKLAETNSDYFGNLDFYYFDMSF